MMTNYEKARYRPAMHTEDELAKRPTVRFVDTQSITCGRKFPPNPPNHLGEMDLK